MKTYPLPGLPCVLALLFLFPLSGKSQHKYVSPTGNDNAPGTIAYPWQTIQYAVDQAAPGMTIFLMAGTYGERVAIRKSGTASGWITIKPYGPGAAKIDVTEPVDASDTLDSYAVFYLDKVAYIKIEGLYIEHQGNKYSPGKPSKGIRAFDIGHHADHIIIRNNHLSKINRDVNDTFSYAVPILLKSLKSDKDKVHHIKITGNHIADCLVNNLNSQRKVKFYSTAIILSGNVENVLVNNNTISRIDGSGIELLGNYADSQTVNTLSPVWDHARKIVVQDNIIQHVGSYGIYLNGSRNVLVERNYLDSVQYGIGVVTEIWHLGELGITERIWIRDNLIHKTKDLGLAVGKFTSALAYDSVRYVAVTNNTFFNGSDTSTAAAILLLPGTLGRCIFQNNIIYYKTKLLSGQSELNYPNNFILKNNQWYADELDVLAWQSPSYVPFSTYRSNQNPGDTQSMFALPLFNGPPTSKLGFKLVSLSAGKNKGIPVNLGWTPDFGVYAPPKELDYYGGKRVTGLKVDLGADELGH